MRAFPAAIAGALLCAPAAALAFETSDALTWPDQGRFPAYEMQPPGRPVRLFVSGGLYHDSNLFRLSDGANTQALLGTTERSDTVGRVGVGLKADLRRSRQELLLDVRADDYRFHRFDFLDHTGYRAGATWKWQAGEAWSGDLGYREQRSLAPFGELQAAVKDLITTRHAFVLARRRLSPEWQLRGGLDSTRYEHSNDLLASAENRTTAVTLGADHFTPQGNSVGAQVVGSEGVYPNRQVVAGSTVDNRYRQLEASAVVDWHVSGKTRTRARIGYTARRHDQIGERDFHGATGRLDFAWTPGAKTILDVAAWRELRSIEDTLASYVLSEGVSIGPRWAPVAAFVVQAKAFRERRDYQGDPGFVLSSAPRRVDTLHGGRLAFGYSPRRFLRASLSLEHGRRDSNVAGGGYAYNLVSANARFLF